MTKLVTPISGEYSFTYNGVNNPQTDTDPLNGLTQYTYDKERHLAGVTLPSGKVITNTYARGRLVRVDTPDWSVYYT